MNGVGGEELEASVEDVVRKVSAAAFGAPLVTNVLRGQVVEAIVACALEPEWTWCAHDYAGWDFERADGVRIEVKQSAILQSWSSEPPKRVTTCFDVAARQRSWDGVKWVPEPGRRAHIYALAHHTVIDETADHRDPSQWSFYVIRAADLPAIKTISLGSLRRLAEPCSFTALKDQVTKFAVPPAAAA